MMRRPEQSHERFSSLGQGALVTDDGIGMKIGRDAAPETGFERRSRFASA